MIRFLSVLGASLAATLSLFADEITQPRLYNYSGRLGGGSAFTSYNTTNLTAYFDGNRSCQFYLPVYTNSLTITLSNFVDGEVANAFIKNAGTNASLSVTFSDSGAVYTIASNATALVHIYDQDSAFHTRLGLAMNSVFSTSQLTVSNGLTSGEEIVIKTNALSTWPTTPPAVGAAAIVSSNGFIYMLVSTNGATGSATWTSTNKFGW